MPEVDLNDIEILRKFRTVEKALNDAITEYVDPSNNAADENGKVTAERLARRSKAMTKCIIRITKILDNGDFNEYDSALEDLERAELIKIDHEDKFFGEEFDDDVHSHYAGSILDISPLIVEGIQKKLDEEAGTAQTAPEGDPA